MDLGRGHVFFIVITHIQHNNTKISKHNSRKINVRKTTF